MPSPVVAITPATHPQTRTIDKEKAMHDPDYGPWDD
jgi:hypothetical protein